MVFSTIEREVFEHIIQNDYNWLGGNFTSDNFVENNKKQNHLNVIRLRVKKKVKRMKGDIDFF